MLRAGTLRHRVRVERATTSRDAHGNPVAAWSEYATRWASVQALAGRELFQARQVEARATHTIRMRYLPGVKPTDRVVWDDPRGTGTRYFNVRLVANPDEISVEHILTVEEVVT